MDAIITDPLLKNAALAIEKKDIEGPKDDENNEAMEVGEMNSDFLRLRVNFYQKKLAQS